MANKKDWKTKLIHSDATVPEGFHSLATPVYRGSTVVFPQASVASDHWDQYGIGYTYGLYGTPTTLELAAKVCELEKGFRTMIVPRPGRRVVDPPGAAQERRPYSDAGKHLWTESYVL